MKWMQREVYLNLNLLLFVVQISSNTCRNSIILVLKEDWSKLRQFLTTVRQVSWLKSWKRPWLVYMVRHVLVKCSWIHSVLRDDLLFVLASYTLVGWTDSLSSELQKYIYLRMGNISFIFLKINKLYKSGTVHTVNIRLFAEFSKI